MGLAGRRLKIAALHAVEIVVVALMCKKLNGHSARGDALPLAATVTPNY